MQAWSFSVLSEMMPKGIDLTFSRWSESVGRILKNGKFSSKKGKNVRKTNRPELLSKYEKVGGDIRQGDQIAAFSKLLKMLSNAEELAFEKVTQSKC